MRLNNLYRLKFKFKLNLNEITLIEMRLLNCLTFTLSVGFL